MVDLGCFHADFRTFMAIFSMVFRGVLAIKRDFSLDFFSRFFLQKSLEFHWVLGSFLDF